MTPVLVVDDVPDLGALMLRTVRNHACVGGLSGLSPDPGGAFHTRRATDGAMAWLIDLR